MCRLTLGMYILPNVFCRLQLMLRNDSNLCKKKYRPAPLELAVFVIANRIGLRL